MSTEELIQRLSSEVRPVSPRALEKRLLLGAGAGFLLSASLVAIWLGLRSDLLSAPLIEAFLTKFAYTSFLAIGAIATCIHLMRPESRPASWFLILAAPVALLGAMAVAELGSAPRTVWPMLIYGESVTACLIRIAVISVPIFLGLVWAARSFAPTRLRAAGAAIGFLAGSLAAAIYTFHCIETTACFIFLWYSTAIMLVSALGALIAPRVLRW